MKTKQTNHEYFVEVEATIMVPVRVILDAEIISNRELNEKARERILDMVAAGNGTTEADVSVSLTKIIEVSGAPVDDSYHDEIGYALESAVEDMDNPEFKIHHIRSYE